LKFDSPPISVAIAVEKYSVAVKGFAIVVLRESLTGNLTQPITRLTESAVSLR
jgi:hypothetical protein